MLRWRNHPDTRRHFFQPDPIDPATHRAWFAASLANPARHLLIAEDENTIPVGVVRFDVVGNEAEIDIYLVPECRGRGLGEPMLAAATDWLAGNTDVKRIRAEVMPANQPSLQMFTNAGFRTSAYRMVLDLPV